MNPSNMLVITEGQLGDLLLLTPALRALRAAHPSSTISTLVVERRSSDSSPGKDLIRPASHTALANSAHVDHVYAVRRDLLKKSSFPGRFRAELEVVRFLRKQKYDAVVVMFPEERFALWAYLSGAGIRVGQPPSGYRWAYTHSSSKHKGDGSIAEYFAHVAGLAGANLDSPETEFFCSDRARVWAENFLQRHSLRDNEFIAVHPGATGDYKIWPPDRYAEMMSTLQREIPILLCGGEQDGEIISEIVKGLEREVALLDSGGSLDRFGAVLQKAALCISNDSGPRHLAVSVGAPSLALFRFHHSEEWGVYRELGSICTLTGEGKCALCPEEVCQDRVPEGGRYGAACLRLLSVEAVVQKARGMLAS